MAIGLRLPAEGIALAGELEGPDRGNRDACAPFQFAAEPVDAAFGDDVFEPGVLAVGAVAEIAMDGHDGQDDLLQLLGSDEPHEVGQPRKGRGVPVAAAHAAADREVVSDDLARLDHRDEPHVVGEDVGVVDRRDGKADLEFARQVGLAVERIDEIFTQVELLAVEPDAVVGRRDRREELGQRARMS